MFGDPTEARLAATAGDARYYVVPGAEGDVCVVEARGPGDEVAATTNCVPRSLLFEQRATIVVRQETEDGPVKAFGLAVDGARTAVAGSRRADVEGNVFWIQDLPPVEKLLVDASDESATVPLPPLPSGP